MIIVFCGFQASIGTVVPGSPADVEGHLQRDDIIVHVDNQSVIGSSHHDVIALIQKASTKGWVTLGIQKGGPRSGSEYALFKQLIRKNDNNYSYNNFMFG